MSECVGPLFEGPAGVPAGRDSSAAALAIFIRHYHKGFSRVKQIFCGSSPRAGGRPAAWVRGWAGALLLGLAANAWAGEGVYRIAGPPGASGAVFEARLSLKELEAIGGREMGSGYFDRALGYTGSRFYALEFAALLEKYDPEGQSDAVLLDCFDDYQGLISVEDIRRYGLTLATRIEITGEGAVVPGWLRPLLVLVPEGREAPRKERFMTANIRAIRFVRLRDYYAPLEALAAATPAARAGLAPYTDNCLFCHPLAGVGGGKGGALTAVHDFSDEAGRQRFYRAFAGMHHQDNPDKQNIEQFIGPGQLADIAALLSRAMKP